MSDFNEELLNDVEDTDLDGADEDALLQDDDEGDGDVIDLIPDEELEESQNDSQLTIGEDEEPDSKRKDKFAVERKAITAPESPVEESNDTRPNRFQRPNNRGQQRGRGFNNFGRGGYNMGRGKFHNGSNRGRFSYGHESGKNKTVLINPRFQGVVHVNNNARLAWDSPQQPQHQYPPNPWASGAPPPGQMQQMQPMQGQVTPGPPMQGMHQGPPMHHQQQQQQQIHSFQPPPPHIQPNFHSSPMQPMMQGPPQNMTPQGGQFMPPHSFMPQPLPPGVHQQPSMQTPNPGGNPFMQNNYQPSPSPVMNFQPPPQAPTPNYPMYNNQPENNMFPVHQQNFTPNRNFVPQNRQGFMPQHNRKLFTQKRKAMTPGFTPNKKFHQRQPRNVQQLQTNTNTIGVKIEDRPTTIKELTVTNVTTVKIEEEDEQTRDLRIKIEQQKREREAILQWKEKRRLEKLTGKGDLPQQPIKTEKKPPPPAQNRRMQFTQKVVQQVLTPIVPVKLKKQSNNIVITSGYSKKFTKYQKKNMINSGRVVLPVPTTTVVSSNSFRTPDPEIELDKKHLSNFLADRKILTKDESLMATRRVVIKNISTSTGDKKIMSISKSIGEVQKLHRDKNERQATITFKSVASAHAFFKKYQRHMLDLSMIEVSLCPMGESDE